MYIHCPGPNCIPLIQPSHSPSLIKCPLFLNTFDLIYPTFIYYLYYLFFSKSWINGNEPNKRPKDGVVTVN